MRRYYQILGISPTASPQEIKEAWLFSLKAFHPDKFAESPPWQQDVAAARTQAINEAYKVLSDPVSRAVYDRDYFREASYQNAPPASSGAAPHSSGRPQQTTKAPSALVAKIRTIVRRPRLRLAVLGGCLLATTVAFVLTLYTSRPSRRAVAKEPPFTRMVIPPTAPTPMPVPIIAETTPSSPLPSVFDLPKLAAVTRRAVGLVIGYDAKGKAVQTGSGFFISEDGRFVTNEHVIHGTKRVSIKMENGAFYSVSDTLVDSTLSH